MILYSRREKKTHACKWCQLPIYVHHITLHIHGRQGEKLEQEGSFHKTFACIL